jgi:hypothetical protein
MANVLKREKRLAVVGALAEGASIRSVEPITGVHRDAIMRLGIRTGRGCAHILNHMMRNLRCEHIQLDEIWGFVRKTKDN